MMSGAFFLTDSKGLPLEVLGSYCVEQGIWFNSAEFFLDAMMAGWSPDTALAQLREAHQGNGKPWDEAMFRYRLAQLFTYAVPIGMSDPDCWEAMLHYIQRGGIKGRDD